jgi:hypothetical protein
MARFDKYDPISGGFRAPLQAAISSTSGPGATNEIGVVRCVSLNANGRVVIGTPLAAGAGLGGLVGVIVADKAMPAGAIIDVMTAGEIVEFTLDDGTSAAASGTVYTSDADGGYGTTAPGAANGRIGHTVEATRLVVRVVPGAEAAA